ncbi:winged helix-turn-helix transcriptional regulator [Nocardioides aurantiacus]|uniref:HxlR family transcriptional regulator n=1 Tax=Nocardioides aurantiacus TaxID=86796 RepID=A0A3N2CY28_9ACTN|nr:helix-turn-helix domain-containing protein [Nocardioides aurantiacus]ROR92445.1 HxlR family transcriptional regulator [Nocardioides aurantiacus]
MAGDVDVRAGQTRADGASGHAAPLCDAALGHAFELLGKRWNGVILGSLMDGPAGFAEVRRATGISDSVLADRLAGLTAAGLVVREVDEGPPVAVHYRLAPRGVALVPVLQDLMTWARDHLDLEPPPAGC